MLTKFDHDVAATLAVCVNQRVTGQDHDDWLEGGAGYDKFQSAVVLYLGWEAVEKAEIAARLPDLLYYKLGLGHRHSGGVDLEQFL